MLYNRIVDICDKAPSVRQQIKKKHVNFCILTLIESNRETVWCDIVQMCIFK